MAVIRGVIFDFGSTLIRFRGDWDEVLRRGRREMAAWLKQAGYPIQVDAFGEAVQTAFQTNFRDRLYDHRERASRQILRQALAEAGVPEVPDDDLRLALQRLYAPSEACWSPVPGVHEALSLLQARGLRLGLLSNASDVENVERLLETARLPVRFDPVVISAAAGVRKPTPSLFEGILRQWYIEPAEAVMVGDLLGEDILGAQRAGMHQIWVRADADPAFNAEFLDKVFPEWTVDTIVDVPPLLLPLAADPLP
jgi:HAD superfamily hydrolase (TIGR01662 family)